VPTPPAPSEPRSAAGAPPPASCGGRSPPVLVACGTSPPDHVRSASPPPSRDRARPSARSSSAAPSSRRRPQRRRGPARHDVELVVTDAADLVELPRRLADLAEHARVSAVIGPRPPGSSSARAAPSPVGRCRRSCRAPSPASSRGASTVVRTVPSARPSRPRRWPAGSSRSGRPPQLAVLVADPVEGSAARTAIEAGAAAGGLPPVAVVEVDGTATQLGPGGVGAPPGRPGRRRGAAVGVAGRGRPRHPAVRELGLGRAGRGPQSSAFVGTYRTLAGTRLRKGWCCPSRSARPGSGPS
jgi:hypothetical protein